jgi:hypothetical protein
VCERIFFEEQINLPICPMMTSVEIDLVLEGLKRASAHFCG